MTNTTTRAVTIHDLEGNELLTFRTVRPDDSQVSEDGERYVMAVETDANITYLTALDVEEHHQFTYEMLAGRKRDQRIYPADGDDYLVCTARSENGLYLCCLQRDHSPVLEATPHMDRRGIAFVEPTLPF